MAESLQNLTIKQQRAALLVAEDELTDEAIAAEVGITRETLHQWKKRDEFAAVVAAHIEAFKDRALVEGFADKRARVQLLNAMTFDVSSKIQKNGYVREEVRIAANGEHVSFEVFDKPMMSELRGLLDDIAKEMGDRKTVAEVSGPDGEPLVLGLVGVDLGKV